MKFYGKNILLHQVLRDAYMLKFLRIKNFAIIDDISFSPGNGLNVLSGETGSGKSILMGALGLLRGGRASLDQIKEGRDKSVIEGVFQVGEDFLKELEEKGFDVSDGDLIIRREISQSGGKIFLNDSPITLKRLREIGEKLIEIHGQFDTNFLLNPLSHILLLDGSLEDEKLLSDVKNYYYHVVKLKEEREKLLTKKKERLQKIDILKFQINEIEGANLTVGEEEKLKERRRILKNYQKICEISEMVFFNLYEEDGSVYERISKVVDSLSEILKIDEEIDSIYKKLEEFKYEVEYISEFFRDFKEKVDYSEGELDEIENRLNLIERLKGKYGNNIGEILSFLDDAKKELEKLENFELSFEKIEKELEDAEKKFKDFSRKLSSLRKKKAGELEKKVNSHLKDLGMERADFKIKVFFDEEKFSPEGMDEVSFLIKTNPGEGFKPLEKIASGGELSRIMLALKLSLKSYNKDTLLIFDEIDSGIGGRIAEKLGNKLKEVGKINQTFCVTHLPQVASKGDFHFLVRKEFEGENTKVYIEPLSKDDRIREIARMLAGEKITKSAERHAKELLGF